MIEIISISLSIVCLLVTIINAVIMKTIKEPRHQITIMYNGKEINFGTRETIIQQLSMIIETGDFSAEEYLKILHDKINEIYHDSNTKISIKVIKDINLEHLEDSKVATWICYPKQEVEHTNLPLYTIKNNTDLYSVFVSNSDYFWVSNLKEFDMFSVYKNENDSFMKQWNTSIVYPIEQKQIGNNERTLIGFLCISSKQEFNNVKKNEIVIECVRRVANKLYNAVEKNCVKQ